MTEPVGRGGRSECDRSVTLVPPVIRPMSPERREQLVRVLVELLTIQLERRAEEKAVTGARVMVDDTLAAGGQP